MDPCVKTNFLDEMSRPCLKKKRGYKKKKSNGSYDKPAFTDEELFLEEGDIKVSWY